MQGMGGEVPSTARMREMEEGLRKEGNEKGKKKERKTSPVKF